ncbi:50S ribosomal protein L29 [Phormidium sp. LEGE 05292]|uniref:50S ribosomal protein L29 n=1 Tax=[Phormidium] sp. LEGE 05292 TaxID=767427 RepID=UPI001881B343|nr:50S ribosomal protein L29 [Phormidium sp. LEGE 05292]MBE9225864.1 50S ribosomal protein L29 [Phormidium sp. LEGE 05292]
MPLPKISEARDLTDAELAKEILEIKQQLFKLRLQKATGRLEKSHQFKHAKHRLAQLLMLEGERQKAAAQGQPEAEQE